MTYDSASNRLSSYTLNGSIAHWGGVIETHLMDSPLDKCKVEYDTLNNSITVIMMAHIEMDLIELPM